MNYVGVDGCPGGWFYVALDDDEGYKLGIAPKFRDLFHSFPDAGLVLVDIPIGLRDEGPLERLCDTEARKILKGRASSVFPAPCRAALSVLDYRKASSVNYKLTGRRLSKQSWYIMDKIRDVDEAIRTQPDRASPRVRETHPEVCFWALNSGKAMAHYKKTADGIAGRIEVLGNLLPTSSQLIEKATREYGRKKVGIDDIIDAMALAITAKFGYDKLSTIPDVPEIDSTGLPMEMVYYRPEARREAHRLDNINFHPHALDKMAERGATEEEVRATIEHGERFTAKLGRTGFRRNFSFEGVWRGKLYNIKQVEVYAVVENADWLVITVITRYF